MSAFATLGPFVSREEAIVVRALLEAEGLAVVAPEFHQFGSLPHIGFAQGFRLLVSAEQEALARRIIAEASEGDVRED